MQKDNRFSPKIVALIGLALTNLFWAGNAVVARFVAEDIPPLTLVFGRWLLAFIILLPFALPHFKNSWVVIRERWLVIFILGIMGITTYNSVLYLAAHTTTAVNITLVSSSLPLITIAASSLMLSVQPTRWQLVGIFSSLAGVLIVISRGDLIQLLNLEFNQGDVLIFGLAILWALYSVILRKYPIALHPLVLLTLLIAAGLPVSIILFIIEWSLLPPFSLSMSSVPIFLYIGIFPSVLAYIFWNHGVKVVGPSISALSCYLMPLFTAILALPILDEKLYSYHFAGGILILIGLYFGSVFKPKVNSPK